MAALINIFSVFRSREKLLRTLLCAIVFVGMAVPFKVMVLIPGLTEVRPVNAIPIIAGLLFGPAGAWGCAIGNTVADLFGTFSIASVFGFLANFAAAYIPYKIWHMSGMGQSPNVKTNKNLIRFVFIAAVSSLCVAVILTLGLDLLNMVWGINLFLIVFLNDFGFSLFLGLPVFIVLTSEQMNIKIIKPEEIIISRRGWIIQRALLLAVIFSGAAIFFGVKSGERLLHSPLLLIGALIFSGALIALLAKE